MENNQNQVLVMGGTEFVGKAMAMHLIKEGYVVDIFTRGEKVLDYDGVREHIKGERKSKEDVKNALSNRAYDFIIDISAYIKEDVEILTSIINRERLKRYVLCSSGGVYKPSENVVEETFNRGENKNWGAYGLRKKEAEDFLFELHKEEGFPCTIFRPTYIYGEGNNLYREGYIFDSLMGKKDIPIPDGNRTTQFIHIEDIVKTFESSLNNEKTEGQAYNITHPDIISWERLIKTAFEATDREVEIIKVGKDSMDAVELPNSRHFFPFRDVTYMLDIKKLHDDGLHVPDIDLKEGLKRAFNWYLKSERDIKDRRMLENVEKLKEYMH